MLKYQNKDYIAYLNQSNKKKKIKTNTMKNITFADKKS